MGKKNRPAPGPRAADSDKPATLKDLLNPQVIEKLKAQSDQMKADEAKRREEDQRKAAEARKAEQKRLDNNFEHLLANSEMDWRKYK
ncbi:YqkE family protein [Paenibacillus chitinolyticus]|uniref:YqkE family protein n=1 Tax=Paenibacillus chitinolyticus TaxID=79263 RepID=UPI002DB9B514|nr:YqkE family protein [Paenibacillus chitinolyticus]MEC0246844.1 YqkE family protein [Paenibacillus chitinolyticus]